MNAQSVIKLIRSSRFKTNSELFLKVNRIAYVDARLWDVYTQRKGEKNMDILANDALKEMIIYIDKSIHVLGMIKAEADSLNKGVRTASLSGNESQDKMSEALKNYVRIEKDWQSLNDLADSIERVGVAGQEQEIRRDLNNLFSDISKNAAQGIDILRNLRSKALDQIGA